MLNIEPVCNPWHNCFDAIVATYANWIKKDYELSLADAWGFDYNIKCNSDKIGDKISQGQNNAFHYLERYHGIYVRQHQLDLFAEMFEIMKNELSNRNVFGITVDTFWCPWDKNYNVFHNKTHHIIINGINENTVNCIDPFYSRKNTEISVEELKKCYAGYCISFGNDKSDQIPNCDKIIVDKIHSHHFNDTFNKIRLFANNIEKSFNYKVEGEGYTNFWHCPLLFKLGRVELSRRRYVLALTYMVEKFGKTELLPFVNQFEDISGKWKLVRSMLVKGQLKNDYLITKDVISLIYEIANMEENVCCELGFACKDYVGI